MTSAPPKPVKAARVRAKDAAGEPRQPGFVVVEGPIGVGKTSLAQKLSETYGSDLMLERPEENPFLERFYQSRKHFALPTQLFFLFQRVRQLQEWKQRDLFSPTRVADFLLEKDGLFARINLDDDEHRLYQQVYTQLSVDLPVPDLVIYLQAPSAVLLDRIRRRGVAFERLIERDYIENLVESYTQFFYHYTTAPLLVVNAADINIVDSAADYQSLLEHIRTIRSGRHFFNPLPAEL
ncbi:MAG: deoxynucleoside kinase [Gammaproteobacteria bacterium]|nr:deoxynucleoside kinase [Gammaproteobacteria bacterium]